MSRKGYIKRLTVAFDTREENQNAVYEGFFRLKEILEAQHGKKMSVSEAIYRMLNHLNENINDDGDEIIKPPEYYEIPARLDSMTDAIAGEIRSLNRQMLALQTMVANIQVSGVQAPAPKERASLYQSTTRRTKTFERDDEDE